MYELYKRAKLTRMILLAIPLLAVMLPGCNGLGEPEITVLTDSIPLDAATDLVEVKYADFDGVPFTGTVGVHYRDFSLEFDPDGTATCSFDVTRSSSVGPPDSKLEMTQRLVGTMTGTLSADGMTITWNDVEGTVTTGYPTIGEEPFPLEAFDPDGNEDVGFFSPGRIVLGSWTRTTVPQPGPDTDGDGVKDKFDQCPDTSGDADNKGCAPAQRDGDGDGITDDLDDCAFTRSDEVEFVDQAGCAASQLDSDSDGVSDAGDECPSTVAQTPVDFMGCPVVSPGPAAQTWSTASDPFFDELDSGPIHYDLTAPDDLTALATLTQARLRVELEESPDESVQFEVLSETVPFMVSTDLAAISAPELGVGIIDLRLTMRYDNFLVTFDAEGNVSWAFDMTLMMTGSFLGLPATTMERVVGTATGTLSEDETTITWIDVTGTATFTSGGLALEEDSQIPLEERFEYMDLGTWTRCPEPLDECAPQTVLPEEVRRLPD